jgi:general secretion pathway protein D
MKTLKKVQKAGRIIAFVVTAIIFLTGVPVHAQDKPTAVPPTTLSANDKVAIDFNDVDIHLFIKFISEIVGKNFVVDQRVKGKITVISPSRISVAEAYRVFVSVLEVHGFTIVESGEITKIVPLPDARTRNIETRFKDDMAESNDKVVSRIIPLAYADASEMRKLLTPLVSKSSIIMDYRPTNTLIITDVQSNIKRLLSIIKTIDVTGIGQEISLIPLDNADAEEIEVILKTTFSANAKTKRGVDENEIRIITDERTNTIIVVGSENETKRVRTLALMLDQKIPRGKEKVHVRYLEFAKAENIAKILIDLQTSGEAKPEKGELPSLVGKNIKITSDSETNSIILYSQKDDYLAISEIVDKLDIPRPMVYIESLIMEVDAGKQLEIGTDWQAIGKTSINGKETAFGGSFQGGDQSSGNLNDFTTDGVLPLGASLGVFTEEITIAGVTFRNLQAVINFYREDKETSIISTPQLLTTDNEEATIVVGKNVPYQTTTSTSNNDTFNSFEYRDVGTTLKITPQISQGNMIRLNINHEISKVESGELLARPTTLKRTIDTTVLVKDKSTIVIGGLIDSQISISEWKVPFLGDIPLLGWLFKSEGKSTEKTNLYIFLTPKVVKSTQEAEDLYKQKSKHIEEVRKEIEGKAESIKLYPEGEVSNSNRQLSDDANPDN